MTTLSQEMEGPVAHVGYRYSWHHLKLQGVNVPRELVMICKRIVDPAGVEHRKGHILKRRIYTLLGSNDCWDVGGYDKFKPFNFASHGCIEGCIKSW